MPMKLLMDETDKELLKDFTTDHHSLSTYTDWQKKRYRLSLPTVLTET